MRGACTVVNVAAERATARDYYETVTRALDELQREGFVQRRGRTYSVHIPPEELVLNGR